MLSTAQEAKDSKDLAAPQTMGFVKVLLCTGFESTTLQLSQVVHKHQPD